MQALARRQSTPANYQCPRNTQSAQQKAPTRPAFFSCHAIASDVFFVLCLVDFVATLYDLVTALLIAARIAFGQNPHPDFLFLLRRHKNPFRHLGHGTATATAYVVKGSGADGHARRVRTFFVFTHHALNKKSTQELSCAAQIGLDLAQAPMAAVILTRFDAVKTKASL
jgi:hypothetical protein